MADYVSAQGLLSNCILPSEDLDTYARMLVRKMCHVEPTARPLKCSEPPSHTSNAEMWRGNDAMHAPHTISSISGWESYRGHHVFGRAVFLPEEPSALRHYRECGLGY